MSDMREPATHSLMGRFRRYLEYRDSGVEWLGEFPAHWGIRRTKFTLASVNDKTDELPEGAHYIALENIESGSGRKIEAENRVTPESQTNAFQPNDVLFGKLRPYLAKALIAEQSGFCSTELLVLRGRHITPRFLLYWCLSPGFLDTVDGSTYGSKMPRANWSFIGDLPALIPPADEQQTIAAFLDHETARIDALIEKKRRFIELLQEKRAALISHAVTRGLNTTVPLKDSGIPWLGQIPAHWKCLRISQLSTKITNGYVGPTRDIFVDEGIPYLQSLHIKDSRIQFGQDYYVSKEWSDEHAKSILKKGDVLIVQTGDIGQVAVVPAEWEGANCHALIIVSGKSDVIHGEYLAWVLLSSYGYASLLAMQTGALHPHLNCGNIKDIPIPIPPIEEQVRIADRISTKESAIRQLQSRVEAVVTRLQEYRAALIASAVTGKIDVRHVLPAETPEAP